MSVVDVGTKAAFGFGNDPVVIRHYTAGIKGGKVLNVDNYKQEFIRAGHVIIKNTTTGEYLPMPVNEAGDAYESLPENCVYVGVAVSTVPTAEPFVAIMYAGEVNDEASPYAVDSIKDAIVKAVPTLRFDHDE